MVFSLSLRQSYNNLKSKFFFNIHHVRNYTMEATINPHEQQNFRKMSGWQIHEYGDENELQYNCNLKIPTIKSSSECLIKINATSVNPIDIAMMNGYGSKFLNLMRCNNNAIEFPISLGREFSGTIAQKGMGDCGNLKIGDEVWGVVPVHRNGCHADYVVVPSYCLTKKPTELTNTESAAILYAGLTAWSGLYLSGNLGGVSGVLSSNGGGKGQKVLVLGASGGVGSIAVQILLAEGAIVSATCSTNAIAAIESLGVNCVMDYTDEMFAQDVCNNGPYDIILDCAGQGAEYANKLNWSFKNYVTFSSPLLRNIDSSGIALGSIKNISNLIETNVKSISSQKGFIKWGYFLTAPQGIQYLQKLVERKKLLPVIDSIYGKTEIPEAFAKVKEGHLRGKVVIDYNNDTLSVN